MDGINEAIQFWGQDVKQVKRYIDERASLRKCLKYDIWQDWMRKYLKYDIWQNWKGHISSLGGALLLKLTIITYVVNQPPVPWGFLTMYEPVDIMLG